MKADKTLIQNRYICIEALINQNCSLSEICLDKNINELFKSVKNVRDCIRRMMNKTKFQLYKDYYYLDNILEIPNNNSTILTKLSFSKGDVLKLKKLIHRHKEIETLIDESELSNTLDENINESNLRNLIVMQEKIDLLLNLQNSKTIKIFDIKDNLNEPINVTIRVSKNIYEKFWSLADKDSYLSSLKKTDVFNILFAEIINKLEDVDGSKSQL